MKIYLSKIFLFFCLSVFLVHAITILEPSETIKDAFNQLSNLIQEKKVKIFRNIFPVEAKAFGLFSLLSTIDSTGSNLLILAMNSSEPQFAQFMVDQIKQLPNEAQKKQLIDHKNNFQMSPLSLALKTHKFDIAQQLLDLGADPNISAPGGSLVFHLAILNAPLDLIKKFLENGGDPQKKNALGQNAFSFALGRREVFNLLSSHQSKKKIEPLGNNLHILFQQLKALNQFAR